MSEGTSLTQSAQSRYRELCDMLDQKRGEIESLQKEFEAISGYLITMGVIPKEEPVKKRRGRRPKSAVADTSG
ncbi:hypothetical protein [Candidatus Magnetominusculus dajiuhuensis]|uniref:hypothetical protein n=1 Tax=Candidatus Magnetominusculus dajiuhuensis TaxID=3137712 RepID=UPI003B432D58